MEEWDGHDPQALWPAQSARRVDTDAWWWSNRFGRAGPRLFERLKLADMSTPFWGNIDSRRLARAYVALAFAQDVAKGYVKENASAHPILSALDMSAKLLEEILEDVLPEEEKLREPQITQIM